MALGGGTDRENRMARTLALLAALAAAVSVSACQTPQQQNALVGGALGAGTGALIGSAVSHGSAGGALAGAAIGAGSGALIGAAATPQPTYYGGRSRVTTAASSRATTAGPLRADAPSGLSITTITGSAPRSIEPEGGKMKKILALTLALAGALSVSACYTPQQQTGTLAGGAIGAGTGALIGSAVSGGSAGGAIAGGIIGAGTGALVGNAITAPQGRCVRWSYDPNGNRICRAWN